MFSFGPDLKLCRKRGWGEGGGGGGRRRMECAGRVVSGMELERTVEIELSFCFSMMHKSIPVVKKRNYHFSASPTDR